MAKEKIKPTDFARANVILDTEIVLSKEQKEDLDALYSQDISKFSLGKIIKGKVIKIDSSGVLVDIDYKSSGLINSSEFSEFELKELKEGSTIDIVIDELENHSGNIVLSFEKAKEILTWERIIKLSEEGKQIEGIVTHKVKGGLNVDVGIPAFLPGSQVDIQRVVNFDQYVGQKIKADIIKINKKRGNIVISRRKYLSESNNEAKKLVLDKLEEGVVIKGVVKNITNYGVFVDIGGLDGLLHITDITWGRIAHPSEVISLGDEINVKVIFVDKVNNKISLGMKQLEPNPWGDLEEKLKVGTKVKGKISSIADYGIFVEIAKEIEGLIHISEISWTERISNLNDLFKVGDEVEAVVVLFSPENKRISLSIKQLQKDPWIKVSEQFKVGQKIEGIVSNVTDFGIFVQLIPGVDGLVHISDFSWTKHVENISELYKKGAPIEVVILSIDFESKRIALGIKQLSKDPWEDLEKTISVGSIIKGEIVKITTFGAFVRLENNIEGLIYNSEISKNKNVAIGNTYDLRVVNINNTERKIGLSLKTEAEKKETKNLSNNNKIDFKKNASYGKSSVDFGKKTKSLLQVELEKHFENERSKKDKKSKIVEDDYDDEE